MLISPLKSHRNILTVLAGLLVILFLDDLGLAEGVNNYLYNLAFRVRGGIEPGSQVVIAAVDEKTLQTLGRWPISRSHYAELIDTVGSVRAIGFTIIMNEPSGDDASLARAAGRSGKAVFPLYIDDRLNVKSPAPLLASLPAGHIHIELGMDGTARQVFNDIRVGMQGIPSLATRLYTVATGSLPERDPSTKIAVSAPSPSALVQSGLLTINYFGPPGTIPTISLVDILQGNVSEEVFRSKIVLVGVTAPGIGERLITPFGQNRNRMSAVEVQATILNNMLEHNEISIGNVWMGRAACLVMAALLLVIFMATTEMVASVLALSVMVGITGVTYYLFARFQLWVAPAAFYASVVFLYVATFLFKLGEAVGRLQQECAIIDMHLASLHEVPADPPDSGGFLGHFSLGGINSRIATLAKASRLLLERAGQTEAANRELEAFSYSVSHDLRAPLRTIAGFVRILREDYAGRLDETGRDCLERIDKATKRMDVFIVSLLELSRISRGEMKRKPLELADMAREIAAELKMSAPERLVEFIVADHVPADADADLMRVVLENLLGNAWKFTATRERAIIEFGVEACGGEQQYFVRDNGVGFAMECADNLFAPFQRLHSTEEFPGTGIGLANVRRIISRHGGRIWAEAVRDEGATFYFTLC